MKILILSKYFYPSIGGLEVIAWLCLQEFARQGHEVRLVTETDGAIKEESAYQIFRKIKHKEVVRHLEWCDVAFHNDAAIRYLPALLQTRKPYVVYMSGYIFPGSSGWWEKASGFPIKSTLLTHGFRLLLATASANIAACAAVASANQTPARIIPNPFDPSEFTAISDAVREKMFLFAGRIVSIKGVDDIIRALGVLREEYGLMPRVTVAGPGMFLESGQRTAFGSCLLALADSLGVGDQLEFPGAQSKAELKTLMNQHRVFLVPSKWNEPIGIVSLEAIASGCLVIGTNGGGLGVSIGVCGLTFPNGDYRALAKCMAQVLDNEFDFLQYTDNGPQHLKSYLPEKVCRQFIEVLENV